MTGIDPPEPGAIVRQAQLKAEFAAAVENFLADRHSIDRAAELGIGVGIVAYFERRTGYPPLGVDGVAFVQPVVVDRQLVDLIYWRASDPQTWRLRCDMAPILGEEQARRAALFGEVIRVYTSPLEWLLHLGQGVVVLDWRCCLSLHFTGARLLVSDLALADSLRRAMTSPPTPFEIRLEAA